MARPIPRHIVERRGARTTRDVPRDVRALLDVGALETVNLCEWLIVDQRRLAETVLAEAGWQRHWPRIRDRLDLVARPTAPQHLAAIGRELAAIFERPRDFRTAYARLRRHRSDVVRSWCCFVVGERPRATLEEKLALIRPLAADQNMGVRETAWMAVREAIALELDWGIELLAAWTADPNASVRRFASEATRPRGVWCRHIEPLKREPQKALPILEPLKSDPARYVQDSVGNWLNDASKSRPRWVRELASRWRRESASAATQRICARALRTLRKADS